MSVTDLQAPEPCASCKRDPARGYAQLDGKWYCHGDRDPTPTCFEWAQMGANNGEPGNEGGGQHPDPGGGFEPGIRVIRYGEIDTGSFLRGLLADSGAPWDFTEPQRVEEAQEEGMTIHLPNLASGVILFALVGLGIMKVAGIRSFVPPRWDWEERRRSTRNPYR